MNITNHVRKGLMLILILLSSACASLPGPSSIAMENRKYDLKESCDAFTWQYEVCTKKFLGICLKKELRSDDIPVQFQDKVLCKKLYDMNFILMVRPKPI